MEPKTKKQGVMKDEKGRLYIINPQDGSRVYLQVETEIPTDPETGETKLDS